MNHTWSEINHDILYKKDELVGFGSKLYEALNERSKNIMDKYLIPAGYEFQKLHSDFQMLQAGKNIISEDILKTINSDIDNNVRYDKLDQYKLCALPIFDSLLDKLPEIICVVKSAVKVSKKFQTLSVETPFGNYPGRSQEDIFNICLEILDLVRYVDVDETLKALVELFSMSADEKEKDKILEVLGKLADYNLGVLRKYGLVVQKKLISTLDSWDEDTLKFLRRLVIRICETVLETHAEGTVSTYDKFEISRANLSGTVELSDLRASTIELLKKLYSTENTEERMRVLSVLKKATDIPHVGDYGDELLVIIEKDSQRLLDFYISVLPTGKYEDLVAIEHDVLLLYRVVESIADSDRYNNTVKVENDLLVEKIDIFKELLNRNDEFLIYKTLVGSKSVFQGSWEDRLWDIREKSEYRRCRVQDYVESIDTENFSQWRERIFQYAQAKFNDQSAFEFFSIFLGQLAERKPTFIMDLLKTEDKNLEPFLTRILIGLLQSNESTKAYSLMKKWINEGMYLHEIARVFWSCSDLDLSLLEDICNKAIISHSVNILVHVIWSVLANYREGREYLIPKLFLPAIQELTILKNTSWINNAWFREECSLVLSGLDEESVDAVLNNLVFSNVIDYHAEKVLNSIAQKMPVKVLYFFGERFKFRAKQMNLSADRYSPLPYKFELLREPLSKMPSQAVEVVGSWYRGSYADFISNGASLVHLIFPDFSKSLEEQLLKLIYKGSEQDLTIVVGILRSYEGTPFLYEILKELIKVLPEESVGLAEVRCILMDVGIVGGDFGLVEAYEKQKCAIQEWLLCANEKVIVFAKSYISHLEKAIASGRRRAEEDIELRKHQYGVDEK